MRNEKGSALITVILITLVLTMVGLAAMLFMSVEDTISGNDRYQKEALYLAEIGLRAAEAKCASLPSDTIVLDAQLQYANANNQVPPNLDQARGYQYPGTVMTSVAGASAPLYQGATALNMVPVTYNPGTGAGFNDRVGYYSLYIRNNPEDTTGSSLLDQDGIIELVSVGTVTDPSGNVMYQKILAEEFNMQIAGPGFGKGVLQKGINAGNTNAGVFQ